MTSSGIPTLTGKPKLRGLGRRQARSRASSDRRPALPPAPRRRLLHAWGQQLDGAALDLRQRLFADVGQHQRQIEHSAIGLESRALTMLAAGKPGDLRIDRARAPRTRPARSRRPPAQSACRPTWRRPARRPSPWPDAPPPRARSAWPPAPGRRAYAGSRSIGTSGGVSLIAAMMVWASSRSMCRDTEKPNRLRFSWRWIMVMTRAPCAFSIGADRLGALHGRTSGPSAAAAAP